MKLGRRFLVSFFVTIILGVTGFIVIAALDPYLPQQARISEVQEADYFNENDDDDIDEVKDEPAKSAETANFLHMAWPFYVYAEADFFALRLGASAQGDVEVLEEQGDWALIPWGNGRGWIYTAADKFHHAGEIMLFDAPDGKPMRVSGGMLRVLRRTDGWLEVENLGRANWAAGWLNPNVVSPPTADLEEFMALFGDNFSLYFHNLESGFTFAHNAEQVFFGASATKAFYALYIYKLAAAGTINLEAESVFTEADFWEGSGFIRHRNEFGDVFTQRELLHLMISPSDNIATRMLRRAHGLNGFRTFVEEIGGNPNFVQTLTYSYISAEEAGLFMRLTHEFVQSNDSFAREFLDNLRRNRYPFITSTHPVASKSGWAENFGGAFHDMAIVLAPSPYVLVILTNWAGDREDWTRFANISAFFEEFNRNWFEPLADSESYRQEPVLLDVRTLEEFEGGHIQGAVSVPLDDLPEIIIQLVPNFNWPISVYCRSGVRSRAAIILLTGMGYTNVTDLGGIAP